MPGPASLAVLSAFCCAAVLWDLRSGKIPNLLCAAGGSAGALTAWLTGGKSALASSLAGVVVGFSILLIPFLLRMVGGGDVKFLAAAGAITGWNALWVSFLVGAAIGGATGLAMMLARERSLAGIRRRLLVIRPGDTKKKPAPDKAGGRGFEIKMPYAVPLSLGLLIVTALVSLGVTVS